MTAHASGADLVAASRQLLTLLLVSNIGYYILAVPLNWWYRRRRPADSGLTRAGHTWMFLLLAGMGTAAFWEWPVLTVNLANAIHPNATVAWRRAFADMSWQRWQFWLFAGVLSFAGLPSLRNCFIADIVSAGWRRIGAMRRRFWERRASLRFRIANTFGLTRTTSP